VVCGGGVAVGEVAVDVTATVATCVGEGGIVAGIAVATGDGVTGLV
jgi:hypothetical protein